ncbi:hypothetical protein BY996DRAFT_6455778 [Phakopsora pachyrhizi]|nr:hypothetical protein BY996DRAFT_6455778 [Phakopsora pachyrhizi]
MSEWLRICSQLTDLDNPSPLCTPLPNLGVAAPSSLPPPGSGSQGVVDSDEDVKSEEGDSEDGSDNGNDLYHGQGDQTINLKHSHTRGKHSQEGDDNTLASILQLLTQQIAGVTTTSSGVSQAFKTQSMKAPDSFDGSNPSKLIQSCQLIVYNDEKIFSKDKKKVLYAASFLSGKAGKWFEPYLIQLDNEDLAYILNLWTSFKTQLLTLFGNPKEVRKAEQEMDHGMA